VSDLGELPLEGVQIVILLTDANGTTFTVLTTDASGDWSLLVPPGAQYLVGEYLPDTGPSDPPGSFWLQTAPAADAEGLRFYTGTVTADQTSLDFGDICFEPDSEGNPLPLAAPCSVNYPVF
jgi:hypothetical protein